MSEREWKPKVGDKVKVTGVDHFPFWAVVHQVENITDGWVVVSKIGKTNRESVHLRNLDPIQEDERRGAPRPQILEGEEVEVRFTGTVYERLSGVLCVDVDAGFYDTSDPRVRQIERRNPGCKACLDRGCKEPGCTARGREARKS